MISKAGIKVIHKAVDKLFDHVKSLLLGPEYGMDKTLGIGYRHELSLPGLYESAVKDDGGEPNKVTLDTIKSIAEGYVEAQRERTKSLILKDVTSFLQEAKANKIKTDLQTVLQGKLTDTFGKLTNDMRKIVDSEAQNGRSAGSLEGIIRLNAMAGVDDPIVFFVIVRDNHVCKECMRLHMLPDGVTPRVWKLSDVSHGYHKRGDDFPSVSGLHPHCRCSMANLPPGYGFSPTGMITFVSPTHDEYTRQQSFGKSEDYTPHVCDDHTHEHGEPLAKTLGWMNGLSTEELNRYIPIFRHPRIRNRGWDEEDASTVPASIAALVAQDHWEDPMTRAGALHHPGLSSHLTPEGLSGLLANLAADKDGDRYLRQSALAHSGLHPSAAGRIAAQIAADPTENTYMRRSALENRHIPREEAVKLLHQIVTNPQEDDGLRRMALHFDHTSPETIGQVATNRAPRDNALRQYAIKHERLPPEVAAKIALDQTEHAHERALALQNKNLPQQVATQIAQNKTENPSVRDFAVQRTDTAPDVLAGLVSDREDHPEVRAAAVKHKNLQSDIAKQVASNPEEHPEVRIVALQHPHLTDDERNELAGRFFREKMEGDHFHPQATYHHLAYLARRYQLPADLTHGLANSSHLEYGLHQAILANQNLDRDALAEVYNNENMDWELRNLANERAEELHGEAFGDPIEDPDAEPEENENYYDEEEEDPAVAVDRILQRIDDEEEEPSDEPRGGERSVLWHTDPDKANEQFEGPHGSSINVKLGNGNTHKYRELRDFVRENSKDKDSPSIPPRLLPPKFKQLDTTMARLPNGDISADKLQQHIDSIPSVRFNQSLGMWTGVQRHTREHTSNVFQLNLTTPHVEKMIQDGVYGTFRKWHNEKSSAHPANPSTFGWVRYTEGPNDIFIDEIQSDFSVPFRNKLVGEAKNAADHYRDEEGLSPEQHQMLEDELVQRAEHKADTHYPKRHYDSIADTVFNGHHSSTVLHEAFYQHLRDTGRDHKTVHMHTLETKAPISGWDTQEGGKEPPVHAKMTYDQNPKKLFGAEPAKYGTGSTEGNDELQGAPVHEMKVRKKQKQRNNLKKDEQEQAAAPKLPRKPRAKKAPEQQLPALIAVHNLSQDNLQHAHELGGLAAPSLAIAHKDYPFNSFGDVTLVADPETVNPAHTPVFESDIYSPRYPKSKVALDEKATDKFMKWLWPHTKKFGPYSTPGRETLEEKGADGVLNTGEWRLPLVSAFLKEKGIELPRAMEAKRRRFPWTEMPAMQEFAQEVSGSDIPYASHNHQRLGHAIKEAIEQYVNSPKVNDGTPLDDEEKKWMRGIHLEDTINEEGLPYFGRINGILEDVRHAGTEVPDYSAERDNHENKLKELGLEDEFNQWAKGKLKPLEKGRYIPKVSWTHGGSRREKKIPYTLENILKEMTKTVRQGENFNYGLGTARAGGAKKFKDIEQLNAARGKLVSTEDFQKQKEAMNQKFFDLSDKVRPYADHAGFNFLDTLAEAIGESYKRGKYLHKELRERGIDVPADVHKEIADFAHELLQMPTEYFEAKPQRIVRLNEFKGAAVPHDASPQTLETLRQNGITHIEPYQRNDAKSRWEAVKKITQAKNLMLAEGDWGDEPLDKAEWKWSHLYPAFKEFGWYETKAGGSHRLLLNDALPGIKVPIKHSHMNGPISPWWVKTGYGEKMGLLIPTNGSEIFVDPDHEFAHMYRAAGYLPAEGNGGPQHKTWTPDMPHEHVPIDKIDHGAASPQSAWKVPKFVAQLKSNPKSVPAVHTQVVNGRHQALPGQDEIVEAAKQAGMTHIPVTRR